MPSMPCQCGPVPSSCCDSARGQFGEEPDVEVTTESDDVGQQAAVGYVAVEAGEDDRRCRDVVSMLHVGQVGVQFELTESEGAQVAAARNAFDRRT